MDEKVAQAVETISGHLAERSAVLFLGAGINAGVTNPRGEEFPLGSQLSGLICRDLLDSPELMLSLEEAAEIARYRLPDEQLNSYIYNLFESFPYGDSHRSLVQLPWDVIYTTNYDLLIERAAEASTTSAGKIRTILATTDDLSIYKEEDVLYYKLHGSIDQANTLRGKLILTKEDYRYYETHRKSLFKRLETDLLSKSFLFVGYSLQDPNFRAIISDCREELGTKMLPLSYAIRRGVSSVEEAYWRERYNLQLLDIDASDFLGTLFESWQAENRMVVPISQRRMREYTFIDSSTRLPRIGESFYRVSPADCTGQSRPDLFFRGAEPSWADIRDHIAPLRDDYWTLMEALFADLVEPASPPSTYLVTGHAGSGKTTLIKTAVFDIARDFGAPVLVHIPGTPLDERIVGALADNGRVIVTIQHAGEYLREIERFLDGLRRLRLPVSVILEERKNQWAVASTTIGKRINPLEIELSALSGKEIDAILGALENFDLLGKLTGTPLSYRKEHFESLADKELLVALRELTTDNLSFDDIVRDEFENIPSETGKKAYVYVSALGQVNLPLRYANLIRVLDLRYEQLGSEVFKPTDGVLVSGEAGGSSRHNSGFHLRARHPIIASIIFDLAAPDDKIKFEIINQIISNLDPGYAEDRRLLEEIVRRRELVNTLSSGDYRRTIYDRLEAVLPGNPYVLQHRSILERDLQNPEQAMRFARSAVGLDKSNAVLQNTLGMALEFAARSARDELQRLALRREAAKIFDAGIAKAPSDPYGYIGKVLLLKQEIRQVQDRERKAVMKASAIALLEEAFDATGGSSVIAGALADFKEDLGNRLEAIDILNTALERMPTDERVRRLLIEMHIEGRQYTEALDLALAGVKFAPNSWRLQRHVARLSRQLDRPIDMIKGHFEAAMRHNRGDLDLSVELGSFLFINHRRSDAENVFLTAKDQPATFGEKRKVRNYWTDESGARRIFNGTVKSVRGSSATAFAVPDNFEAFFWRTHSELSDLREGDRIRFNVGFNALGAIAQNVERLTGSVPGPPDGRASQGGGPGGTTGRRHI